VDYVACSTRERNTRKIQTVMGVVQNISTALLQAFDECLIRSIIFVISQVRYEERKRQHRMKYRDRNRSRKGKNEEKKKDKNSKRNKGINWIDYAYSLRHCCIECQCIVAVSL
jgi:hypothetical protein